MSFNLIFALLLVKKVQVIRKNSQQTNELSRFLDWLFEPDELSTNQRNKVFTCTLLFKIFPTVKLTNLAFKQVMKMCFKFYHIFVNHRCTTNFLTWRHSQFHFITQSKITIVISKKTGSDLFSLFVLHLKYPHKQSMHCGEQRKCKKPLDWRLQCRRRHEGRMQGRAGQHSNHVG